MKSSKQRRAEIRLKRLQKAQKLEGAKTAERIFAFNIDEGREEWARKYGKLTMPDGAVKVDPFAIVTSSAFIRIPLYYQDIAFTCVGCDQKELWTAKAQKWWYEIAKGDIESTAKYCRPCRQKRRKEKQKAKRDHFSGLIKKYGLAEAANRLKMPEEKMRRWLAKNEEA